MSKKFNAFDKIKDSRLPALYAEIGLDFETGLPLAKMAEYDAMPVLEVAALIAFADDVEAPALDPRTAAQKDADLFDAEVKQTQEYAL